MLQDLVIKWRAEADRPERDDWVATAIDACASELEEAIKLPPRNYRRDKWEQILYFGFIGAVALIVLVLSLLKII